MSLPVTLAARRVASAYEQLVNAERARDASVVGAVLVTSADRFNRPSDRVMCGHISIALFWFQSDGKPMGRRCRQRATWAPATLSRTTTCSLAGEMGLARDLGRHADGDTASCHPVGHARPQPLSVSNAMPTFADTFESSFKSRTSLAKNRIVAILSMKRTAPVERGNQISAAAMTS